MAENIKVLALVGSLRAASINRQIAELAAAVAPDGVTVSVFDGLAELPFYNEDLDDAMNSALERAPGPVAALRAAAAEADAALVVTPEYNGSIPAVVKNAIDWLSRPFGNGALKDKPLAVIGGSLGQYGGVWAHDETRKSFGIAGARVVGAIKLSVAFKTLEGKAPAEHAELSANVRDVVGKLTAEVG
ncbi:NAD(P)H-dependent oxidoreductase [Mycobacterium angelicum]|uniref:NAD(P)H-dependent oxidoreductase n=1 Tax=Mycobacterium angelicum TaxID=470074 RepID=UPI001B80DA70|nr:NADPH-dependent FMN reductase [Mycobacterium angelicum]MCV7197342.1 NAD(P)H-dependent oxidoreductase [Mycobacterium angelicum]